MGNRFGELKALAQRGFFHILTGGVITKLITFASSIVVVRLLSKDDYSIIAYTDNIYSYIFLIAGLGFASGVLKFCVSDNMEKNRAYFQFALRWGLLFQFVVSVGSLFAFGLIDFPIQGVSSMGLLLVLYPCFNYLFALLQSMLRAGLHNKAYAWVGMLQAVLVLFLSILFVLAQGYLGVVWARYIAVAACIVVILVLIRSELFGSMEKITRSEMIRFTTFSLSLLFANMFSMAMPLNEAFLVNNILQDPNDIANFKVAALIPSQITFFTSAVVIYYTPYFARMKAGEEAWQESVKCARINAYIIAAVVVIGVAINSPIILLVYGSAYGDACSLAMVMWIAYGINAGFRMVPLNILPIIGFEKFNLVVSVVSCAIHFVFDAVMIWLYGVSGAVLASIIIYLVSGFVYWVYLAKRTRGVRAI